MIESACLQQPEQAPWLPLPAAIPITSEGLQEAAQGTPPAFVSVLRHPSRFSPDFWTGLFVRHAAYHRLLGFAATLVYARDDLVEALLSNEELRTAALKREIFIVRWADMDPFPLDPLQVYDQVRRAEHVVAL